MMTQFTDTYMWHCRKWVKAWQVFEISYYYDNNNNDNDNDNDNDNNNNNDNNSFIFHSNQKGLDLFCVL